MAKWFINCNKLWYCLITNYIKLPQTFLKKLLTFQFIHREKPILAVFHQDWCGACQRKNLFCFLYKLIPSFTSLVRNFRFPVNNSLKVFWRILEIPEVFFEPSQPS